MGVLARFGGVGIRFNERSRSLHTIRPPNLPFSNDIASKEIGKDAEGSIRLCDAIFESSCSAFCVTLQVPQHSAVVCVSLVALIYSYTLILVDSLLNS